MARLRLTLHNVSYFEKDGLVYTPVSKDVLLSTEKEGATLYLSIGGTSDTKVQYNLNIVDFHFQKKMYQPTEITAQIQISMASGNDSDWTSITRKQVEAQFKHLQVSLDEVPEKDTTKTDAENLAVKATNSIGSDYYVHEVLPHYQTSGMYVTLKIYSLDKLLTLRKASRTFTAKRLSTVLGSELGSYSASYNVTSTGTDGNVTTSTNTQKVMADLSNMRQLGTSGSDHIFPYLVQYNESFYDMLARTCNRWGEFMYYEDNALRVGYDNDEKKVKDLEGFNDIHFFDFGAINPTISSSGFYDLQASNEKQFIGNTLEKSPNEMSGLMYYPNGKFDKVVMKKLAAFFKNDKSLPTFITNQIFDDTYDIVTNAISVHHDNSEFDDKWFPSSDKPGADDQYNEGKDEFNQFTEFGTGFKDKKYKTILAAEEAASKNAIHINFDTTYPGLKLGNIIEYNEERFIVVEVRCRKHTTVKYTQKANSKDIDVVPTTSLVFEVVATAGSGTTFYPAILPGGHVRLADPQIATIVDADDPTDNNQVRVVFPWQYNPDDETQGAPKDANSAADDPTPWLKFTTNAAGAPTIGKHYKGDMVLVGFVDGNVERPYVLGGLAAKGNAADVIHTTPGGHQFKLNDDPSGLTHFLMGMFYPGFDTLSSFIPGLSGLLDSSKIKNSAALGGGFELSDNYGIYKITGSSDSREINVASPWGDVNISAFTGITLSAPNGDITIKGKNVSIMAGNNLELTSGTNVSYKLMGGSASGFFADVATAVVKKLAEKLLSLVTIDLSMVRSVFEIAFRPTEGKLLVKSNRYLMLESGKGECDYPISAYTKDQATLDKLLKKAADKDIRPGLKLGPGVQEMVEKIGSVCDAIDLNYKNAYQKCRRKQYAFNRSMKNTIYLPWCKGYDPTKELKVCSSYDELKEKFWKDGKDLLKEDDLGFLPAISNKAADVDDDLVTKFNTDYPNFRSWAPQKKKEQIATVTRQLFRNNILKAANDLRQAIIDFNALIALDENTVKSYFGKTKATIPEAFKKSFFDAMKKENHGDVIYFKAADDEKKTLTPMPPLDDHKKVLKRKAAILMLEGMGFKDEWRQKIIDPDWANTHPNPTAAELLSAPRVISVARDVTFDTLKDNGKWNNYADSIVAVPPLKADHFKVTNELMKSLTALKENYTGIFDQYKENKSWGEAKNGSILFSSGANVYDLKATIQEVDAPWKENLTSEDDGQNNGPVATFLSEVIAKMKRLD